jgi:hypothetical protein
MFLLLVTTVALGLAHYTVPIGRLTSIDFCVLSSLLHLQHHKLTWKSNPITGLDRHWGSQEVKAPRFQDNRHMNLERLSVLCTRRSWMRHCATSRFSMVSLEFFIDITLRSHYCHAVHSASNRNEYQEYFLAGEGGRCVELTTWPPSCADCLKIWEFL